MNHCLNRDILLNRHQFVAFPPNATYEKDFEDMKLPVCGSSPPLECNLDMDSKNYDLESNWSELDNDATSSAPAVTDVLATAPHEDFHRDRARHAPREAHRT